MHTFNTRKYTFSVNSSVMRIFHVAEHTESRESDNEEGGKQDAYGFSLTNCSGLWVMASCAVPLTIWQLQTRRGSLTEPGKLLHLPVFHMRTQKLWRATIESNPGGWHLITSTELLKMTQVHDSHFSKHAVVQLWQLDNKYIGCLKCPDRMFKSNWLKNSVTFQN